MSSPERCALLFQPLQFMFYVTITLMLVALAIFSKHVRSEPSSIDVIFSCCVTLGILTRAWNFWDFRKGWSEIEPFLDSSHIGPHQIVEFAVELLSIGLFLSDGSE